MKGVAVDAYRTLLARPHALSVVAGGMVGRIPIGIVSVSIVLMVGQNQRSFGLAGVVAGAYAVAAAATAPLLGRLVDRLGQTWVLIVTAALNGAGLAGLALASNARLGGPLLLVAAAALAGAVRPPLSACVRALWPELAGSPAEVATAYALESVLIEVFYLTGLLLSAVVATVASPAAALLAAAGLSLAGVCWVAASPPSRAWRAGTRTAGRGALRPPGMRTVVAANAFFGAAFGTLIVTMPAFATRAGSAAGGALALAALTVASMVSGFWYGTRRHEGPLLRRYLVLGCVYAAGFAPLPLAPSLPVMVALAAVAGLALAPLTACLYLIIDRVAPVGAETEAFTWVVTANNTGVSLGSALAGSLVGTLGVRQAIPVAFAAAAVGALITLVRRRTLERESGAGGRSASGAGAIRRGAGRRPPCR